MVFVYKAFVTSGDELFDNFVECLINQEFERSRILYRVIINSVIEIYDDINFYCSDFLF